MVKNNVKNNFLIPNVTKIQEKGNEANKLEKGKSSEFGELVQKEIEREDKGINISTHAAKRLKERNIEVNSEEFYKLKDAVDKLKEKGGKESLIITNTGAYIVDVKNNTIVTAIDKENIRDNIFTKIDSTILLD
ncbi:MAG: TIGR02530 family flagellar biosynthesis protein [Bacteriovoracaceae bacterium]